MSHALPLVGPEQNAPMSAKTKLARTGAGAVKQLHVLAAASMAGFEVITDGRFCGDHRGRMRSLRRPDLSSPARRRGAKARTRRAALCRATLGLFKERSKTREGLLHVFRRYD